MLASPLPPPFLETYSLSTSSLGCNALCIVISFLALWSICLSSYLVHFKKGSLISNEGYSPGMYSFDKVYYYYYYYFTPYEFFTEVSESKSPHVSRTLLSIITNLKYTVD